MNTFPQDEMPPEPEESEEKVPKPELWGKMRKTVWRHFALSTICTYVYAEIDYLHIRLHYIVVDDVR